MNKVTTKKISTYECFEKTIKHPKHGTIICSEGFVNGIKTDQSFRLKKPNHEGYEPERMTFIYYGGPIDTHKVSETHFDDDCNYGLTQVFVEDLEKFSDFKNLYCLWMSMDNNIFRLTDPRPLPVVMRCELWQTKYDLDAAAKKLSSRKDVRNIIRTNNCVQNWDICGKHNLVFDYYSSQKTVCDLNGVICERDRMIADIVGVGKFRYEEKED